jgi:glycosyltransferase involved in cell wall biosynthesis
MPVAAVPDLASPLPRVSVILPVYNHAAYVTEALDSVRAQTLPDWELIVIDDGSTDDSRAVLQRYVDTAQDPRIRLYLQDNAGSHAAINRGLSLARAPYLAILNSDDRFAPTRLERLLALAQQHPGELLAVTAVRLVDGVGQPVEPRDPQFWWLRMYRDILAYWRASQQRSANPARDALLWGNFTISTSNFFMSRALFERLGGLGHFRYVLDWEYALRVTIECPQAFHFLDDEPLLDYRLHGSNTILGGAIRNHVEAAWMLRRANKRIVRRGEAVPPHAVERIRYLDRFVRQQLVRKRDIDLKVLRDKLALTEAHVGKLEAQLHEQHGRLAAMGQERERFAVALHQAQQQAQVAQQRAQHLEQIVADLHASTSWRATAPLRWIGGKARVLARKWRTARRLRAEGWRWGQLAALAVGLKTSAPAPAPVAAPPQGRCTDSYRQWLAAEDRRVQALHAAPGLDLSRTDLPRISLLVPVHDTDPAMLQAMLDSVRDQIYPHWELCLCDDASTRPETLDVLTQAVARDPRIRLHRRDRNGHIVHASNDALALATGDWVALLDHDDTLAPHALLRVAQALLEQPDLELLYTDEDKLDEQGQRCLPYFKPDWSPALLWSQNYVGHLLCVKRTVLQEVGGWRAGTEGSQDYDLVLRLAERGVRAHHLPEVLYHWRLHAGSTAINTESKPYAHTAGREALARHLARRYPQQFDRVDEGAYLFVYEPRFKLPSQARASIIIPTKDKVELLKPCIDSILGKSTWPHFEIIILDNNSSEPQTAEYLQSLAEQEPRVRVVDAPIPFNWSRLNNIGASHASGDVLVFLNNDTLVITPDWLERLMELALLPDVGTVGPLLLYEDGTIQHAGVVVGMGGWADHVYKAMPVAHLPGPYVANTVMRNVMANTGACVAVARDTLAALGGFDEAFEICGSDVELGVRAHKRGLQNIYLPSVQLYHLESKTRSPHVPEVDFIQSDLKYAPYRLGGDPFFNPNLDVMASTPTPRHPQGGAA